MAHLVEVRVPDIGDYKDVEVIEVAVREGDVVAVDATLITLETEKATMDVPATAAGVVRKVAVRRGGHVSQGDLIVIVEADPATASVAAAAPAAADVRAVPVVPPDAGRGAGTGPAQAASAPALPAPEKQLRERPGAWPSLDSRARTRAHRSVASRANSAWTSPR